MKHRSRYLCLLVVAPTIASAHGTEIVGMGLGSIMTAICALVSMAVLPGKPAGKFLAFVLAGVTMIISWMMMFGPVGNWLFFHVPQSVITWMILISVLPVGAGSVAYCFFCRSNAPSHNRGPSQPPEPTRLVGPRG